MYRQERFTQKTIPCSYRYMYMQPIGLIGDCIFQTLCLSYDLHSVRMVRAEWLERRAVRNTYTPNVRVCKPARDNVICQSEKGRDDIYMKIHYI